MRFLIGDAAVFGPLQILQFGLIGVAVSVGADRDAADLGEIVCAETAENIADAPDREAENDQAHQDRHDDAAEQALGRGTH